MPTAKVSVAIGEDELSWARSVARREGKSLSAVVTESLSERRRLAALRDVVDWMGEGDAPLSAAELAAAKRAIHRVGGGGTTRTKRPAAASRRRR